MKNISSKMNNHLQGIKFRILALLLWLPISTFAQNIEWSCTSLTHDESCDGYIGEAGHHTLVAMGFNRLQRQNSMIKMYSNNLGSLVTLCGANCSLTNFFEKNSDRFTEDFQNVIAVNSNKDVVASVNLGGVLIQPIFSPEKKTQIILDFDSTSTTPSELIRVAHFNPDGNLEINYKDMSGHTVSQIIPVDYQNFDNNPSSAYQWICAQKICTMYVTVAQKKKVLFTRNQADPWGYDVVWPQKKLAWFQLPCGTHCSDSYFVDYQTGQISSDLYLVYALNVDKRVVAIPKDDQNAESILITPIFGNGKEGITITRNFSNTSSMGVVNDSASFDQHGNLLLNYFTGQDFTEVQETIPIDYQKLPPENTAS